MNFNDAIQAHTNWKLRLDNFARGTLAENLDVAALRKDDVCALGKWLHEEGKQHAADPKFAELIEAHAAFHRCAAAMADLVRSGHAADAVNFINSRDSEFGLLSLRVVGILMGFRLRYGEG